VIKKPCKRGGYSPARGLQNTNPQWVVAPVKKNGFITKKFVTMHGHMNVKKKSVGVFGKYGCCITIHVFVVISEHRLWR